MIHTQYIKHHESLDASIKNDKIVFVDKDVYLKSLDASILNKVKSYLKDDGQNIIDIIGSDSHKNIVEIHLAEASEFVSDNVLKLIEPPTIREIIVYTLDKVELFFEKSKNSLFLTFDDKYIQFQYSCTGRIKSENINTSPQEYNIYIIEVFKNERR